MRRNHEDFGNWAWRARTRTGMETAAKRGRGEGLVCARQRRNRRRGRMRGRGCRDVAALVALAEKISPDLTVVGQASLGKRLDPTPSGSASTRSLGRRNKRHNSKAARSSRRSSCSGHSIPRRRCMAPTIHPGPRIRRFALWIGPWSSKPMASVRERRVSGGRSDAARDSSSASWRRTNWAGGRRILLEETLEGDELSFILLTDGERSTSLVPTRTTSASSTQ